MRLPRSGAKAGLLAAANGDLIAPAYREAGIVMKLSIVVRVASLAARALLTVIPASAQTLGTGIPLNKQEAKTQEQIEKQKAIEDAYKETLKKIPDAKQSNDPWGGVREAETPRTTQAKAKPAPKKPGGAAN